MLHEIPRVVPYGFTLVANCLQTVELPAISLYKQYESIAHATEPIESLTGLAADPQVMQKQRGQGRSWEVPAGNRGHYCQLWTSEARHFRDTPTSGSITLSEKVEVQKCIEPHFWW